MSLLKMSSSEFDSVKAEKADAIRRYNRNRICVFCLRLIGALALFCSTVTYFPVVRDTSSAYLSIFSHQIYVFVLVNALIFSIYHFSTTANSSNSISAVPEPDLYDQYVSLSSTSCHRRTITDKETQLVVSPVPVIQTDENSFSDKQIIVCENADSAPAKDNQFCDITVSETYRVDTDQEMRFRRTQSEKYTVVKKKKIRRRELRRSDTGNGRELVVADGDSSVGKSMHDMDSEEFRLTIESFIASKKKILRDENFAVFMEEKEESFTAITYQ